MKTRTLTTPLLALTAALALTACTTDDEPVADGSTTAARSTGASAAPSTSAGGASAGPASSGAAAAGSTSDLVVDRAAVLEVEDQTSEGPTVRVKLAAVSEGGFVVVASEGGKKILGFGNVPASTSPATLQVSLADEVNKKTELVAMLYRDDNHTALFDAGDRPVSNGKDDEDDAPKAFPGEFEVFSFTGKPVVNS